MVLQKTTLSRIQKWYQTNCNDDWEHGFGITIETLDNPGWNIKIDLSETPLEELQFEMNIDNGRFDWIAIKIIDKVFEAACDPTKLDEVLNIFLNEIIPKYSDPNFHYKVYIPLIGAPTKLWRPVNAKMLTEETLEIIDIPELKYEDIKTKTLEELTFDQKEIFTYKINHSVGDRIEIDLMESFDGVTLIEKEE